ncbi:hypothetical protein [Conexibacter sp. SYSU D00693]|uniref:hypothetical protein n=1 Tax=Conexibacter sp. SYSU D00693 TaxID=2812560 RepID=UPI00196B8FC6|nr:hypothetical protein [Conexibacter sp. SYSU D00693]
MDVAAVQRQLEDAAAGPRAARERLAEEHGVPALTDALAREPGALQRAQLAERRLQVVVDVLAAPAAQELERVRRAVRALGWPSARALHTALGTDVAALEGWAAQTLQGPPPRLGEVDAAHDLPRLRAAAAGTTDAAARDALARLDARLAAAAVLHDLELLEHGPVEPLRDRYARRMAHASGLDWPAAAWLVDGDPLLGSAAYASALSTAASTDLRLALRFS